VAIVNWLVQGCIVAAFSAVVLRVLRNARAQARYTFCWGALATVLALPVISLLHVLAAPAPSAAGAAISRALISVPHDRWNWIVAISILCGLWSTACGFEFLMAASALRRARRGCRAFPPVLESSLRHWANIKGCGRQARLMLSDDVQAAAVLSGPLPIIAVSPSVVDHLTAEEVDLIVIHEWAHIQRRDDAAHLVQVVCRIVAGWHPAVSWLNRRLHEERESACDEMAVALMRSPKAYAASLLKLADLRRVEVKPLPVVGALSSSQLALRVQRIVSKRRFVSPRWSTNAVAASTILLAVVSSAVAALRIVETTGGSAVSTQPVAAADLQRFVPSRLEPARMSEHPASAKTSEFFPGPRNATPPRSESRGHALDPKPLAHSGAATTPQVGGSRDNSAPDAPLPSIVAPISLEPLPVAQSILTQRADSAPQAAIDTGPVPPWTAAANAGRAVGQGSKNAGVATAGFFTRISKRIAGSF